MNALLESEADRRKMDVPLPKRRTKHKRWLSGAAAVLFIVMITVGARGLRAAAPSVEKSSVWIDTVKRGDLVIKVQGQGKLVPEGIQWLSAVCAARVEKIAIKPGTHVEEDTVVVELSNPDIQLQALEAGRQYAAASSELTNLQATQRNQRFAQESVLAGLSSELDQAKLRAAADRELADKGFLSGLEMSQSRAKADALSTRIEFERKRLVALSDGMAAQVSAQQAQIDKLRSIAEFRSHEVQALRVRAGITGVLQEVPLQVGQWVTPGTLLAKIVQPERLKAELRVAETRAKDVQLGQHAFIDTRNGLIGGTVAHIDPAVQSGTVKLDVALDGPLPKGARPDLTVEGTIELERLTNVLSVGRPAFANSAGPVAIFKVTEDGRHARRVSVQLGRSSVNTVEVFSGLEEGDRVILSELSQMDNVERIALR